MGSYSMEIQSWSFGSNHGSFCLCAFQKKVALSRIHEAFAGIDLTYLVGESIDPEDLNDDLLVSFLTESMNMDALLCIALFH